MKIGLYDSGLGGISVLKEFLDKYANEFSYYYFGDSARAPYGSKSQEELLVIIKEIMEHMHSKQLDLVVSACNTTSMLINKLDLTKYEFKTISLFDVINMEVKKTNEEIALLATSSNIKSGRYKDWGLNIYPLECPLIVPLVEARKLDEAKLEWQKYLASLPQSIKKVIVGCTHYEFLVDNNDRFEFISPAKLVIGFFEKYFYDVSVEQREFVKDRTKLDLEIFFTQNLQQNVDFAKYLLEVNDH